MLLAILTSVQAAKAARAQARAGELLAGRAPAKDITDELDNGKMTKLLLWQVEAILAEYRKRGTIGRRSIGRPGSRRRVAEKPGALVGDFCYSMF